MMCAFCGFLSKKQNVGNNTFPSVANPGTAANHIRVSSAVCQKNIGATYIMDVNKAAGLSPGGLTEKYRKREEQKLRSRDLGKRLISSKQRRLFLKNRNSSRSTVSQRYVSFKIHR